MLDDPDLPRESESRHGTANTARRPRGSRRTSVPRSVSEREFVHFADVVLDHIRDAVLVTDAQIDPPGPRILYANAAYAEMTGFHLEHILGKNPRFLRAGDEDAAERARVRAALERAEPVRAVLHNRTADGRRFWVEVSIAPVRDGDGAVTNFVSVQRDVSNRAEDDRQLRRALEGYEWVIAVGQIGTWQLSLPEGTFAHNDWCAWAFAGEPTERPLSLEECFQAIHPEDRGHVRAELDRVVTEGGSYETVFRVVHPDGSTRWVFERARRTSDSGEPATVEGVVTDVTDRYEPAHRITRMLDTITDGYIALDHDWRVTHLNQAAEAHLGCTRDEVVGRVLWETFPELVGTDFEAEYHTAARTGAPRRFEARYEPWERWYEERVFPTDEGLAVFFLDVSERIRNEEEQRRLLESEHAARVAAEAAQAQLAYAASHDELTSLLNRGEFERRLGTLLADADAPVTLLFFDLDDFKIVNDSLGHAAGDELLSETARRLEALAPPDALICRFGGDEFLIATAGQSGADADALCQRLRAALREPHDVRGRRVTVAVSVGIAHAHTDDDAATLVRNADTALFDAKRRGRDQVAVYDAALHQRAVERLDLEADLRNAVHADEFELHYQPIFELRAGARVGAEALLRWHHPEQGTLGAGRFIALAEESGVIVPIGDWALETVCDTVLARRATAPGETLWLNLAPQQLGVPDFVDRVADAIRARSIRPGELGVELTERTLIRDPEMVTRQLRDLSDLGIRIAIDDFGTGYSSMTALQHHPVDMLKIDRAFTEQLHTHHGRAIVGAIVELAHALDAIASAEGVEHAAQWEALRELGCDSAAGYLMARPQPLDLPMPARYPDG